MWRRIRLSLWALLVVGSLWVQATSAQDDAVGDLSAPWGLWRVVGVLVDGERTDRPTYGRDDARLLGRKLRLDRDQVESNLPERRECRRPRLLRAASTLEALLPQTMPTPASAADYGLTGSGSGPSVVWWLQCGSGQFGPAPPRQSESAAAALDRPPNARTWLAGSAWPGQVLLRWYDGTLLVLAPESPDKPAH